MYFLLIKFNYIMSVWKNIDWVWEHYKEIEKIWIYILDVVFINALTPVKFQKLRTSGFKFIIYE